MYAIINSENYMIGWSGWTSLDYMAIRFETIADAQSQIEASNLTGCSVKEL